MYYLFTCFLYVGSVPLAGEGKEGWEGGGRVKEMGRILLCIPTKQIG